MGTQVDWKALIKWPLIIAVAITVIRLVLEMAGAPEALTFITGVNWLLILVPIYFMLKILDSGVQKPFVEMLKVSAIFAVIVRLIIAVTYAAAYGLKWDFAARFSTERGGPVGPDVTPLQGYLTIPLTGMLFGVVIAVVAAAIVGGITMLVKQRAQAAKA